MFKLSLGKLEQAKNNPAQVANEMKANKTGGSSKSYVGSFKKIVREFHEDKDEVSTALNRLSENLEITFKTTDQNVAKNSKFCDSFLEYANEFEEKLLAVDKFQINLKWELLPKSMLTGHSPFLCSTPTENIAYYFQEKGNNWEEQLKFPLVQIYLAEHYYKCEVDQLKVGIYNILDKKFELKCFEDFELDNAIEETKSIFKNVRSVYEKL